MYRLYMSPRMRILTSSVGRVPDRRPEGSRFEPCWVHFFLPGTSGLAIACIILPSIAFIFCRVLQSRNSLNLIFLLPSLSFIPRRPMRISPPPSPPCPPRRKVIYLVLEGRVGNLSVLSAAKVPALFSRERPISPDPSPQILA